MTVHAPQTRPGVHHYHHYHHADPECHPMESLTGRVIGVARRFLRHIASPKRKLRDDVRRLRARTYAGHIHSTPDCSGRLVGAINERFSTASPAEAIWILKSLNLEEIQCLIDNLSPVNVLFLTCHILPELKKPSEASYLIRAIENRISDDATLKFSDIAEATLSVQERWASKAYTKIVKDPVKADLKVLVPLLTPQYLHYLGLQLFSFQSLQTIKRIRDATSPHQQETLLHNIETHPPIGPLIPYAQKNPLEVMMAAEVAPDFSNKMLEQIVTDRSRTRNRILSLHEEEVLAALIAPIHLHGRTYSEQLSIYKFVLFLILLGEDSERIIELLTPYQLRKIQEQQLGGDGAYYREQLVKLRNETDRLAARPNQAVSDRLHQRLAKIFTELEIAIAILDTSNASFQERVVELLAELFYARPETDNEKEENLRHLRLVMAPVLCGLYARLLGTLHHGAYKDWHQVQESICLNAKREYTLLIEQAEATAGHLSHIVIDFGLDFPRKHNPPAHRKMDTLPGWHLGHLL